MIETRDYLLFFLLFFYYYLFSRIIIVYYLTRYHFITLLLYLIAYFTNTFREYITGFQKRKNLRRRKADDETVENQKKIQSEGRKMVS